MHFRIERIQSQKIQGFCVADFATLSDERRSRSKIFLLFIWMKEPCVEGLARSKLLGISQTELAKMLLWCTFMLLYHIYVDLENRRLELWEVVG